MKKYMRIGLAIGLLLTLLLTGLAWRPQSHMLSQASTSIATYRMIEVPQTDLEKEAAVYPLPTAGDRVVTPPARTEVEVERDGAKELARQALSRQLAAQALNLLEDHFDLALLLSVEASRIADTGPARDSLWQALDYRALTTFLYGHRGRLNQSLLSPNGQIMASSSCDDDRPQGHCGYVEIRLWDLATRQPIGPPLTGHTDRISSLAFSPDGQILASGSWDRTLILWNVTTRRPISQTLIQHPGGVRGLAFSPDGQTLASASGGDTINLWDVATGQPLGQPLSSATVQAWNLIFSPDGQTLASGGNGAILLWDLATGQPGHSPLTGRNPVFSPDSQILALATCSQFAENGRDCEQGEIRRWQVDSGQPWGQPLTGHTNWVKDMVFSPDGQTMASLDQDDRLILWDLITGQPIGQPLTGRSLAFSPDGQELALLNDDGLSLWEVTTGQRLSRPMAGPTDGLHYVRFSPDSSANTGGKLLAWGGTGQAHLLWEDHAAQAPNRFLAGGEGPVTHITFSPDGQTMASGGCLTKSYSDPCPRSEIRLWDVATGQALGPALNAHQADLAGLVFGPTSQRLVSRGQDDTIIIWDVSSGQPLGPVFRGQRLVLSPVGSWLATLDGDTINLLDLSSGQRIGPPFEGQSVAFSPDGQMIAVGGHGDITLRETETGRALGPPLSGHMADVTTVAFSPDGQILVSGSRDQRIMVWDIATGQSLGRPLTGHNSWIKDLIFPPHGAGQILVSHGWDNTFMVWDIAQRQLLKRMFLPANTVVFSPDYQTLALTSFNCGGYFCPVEIQVWAVSTGQPLGAPVQHGFSGRSLAFSPDSRIVAAGSCTSIDNHGSCAEVSIRLLDAVTGQPIGSRLAWQLRGLSERISSLDFSPDGQVLAAGGSDGSIVLWDVSLEARQDRACRIANRNLTATEWLRYLGNEPYRLTCPEIQIDPQAAQDLVKNGRRLASLGDVEGAVAQFQQALTLDPNLVLDPQAEAHQLVAQQLVENGRVLAKAGDVEGALIRFQEALALDPSLELDPASMD